MHQLGQEKVKHLYEKKFTIQTICTANLPSCDLKNSVLSDLLIQLRVKQSS